MVMLISSLLIPAAEGRQEQAGEPDADDAPGSGWVSEPTLDDECWGLGD